jgi:hypothetical protein
MVQDMLQQEILSKDQELNKKTQNEKALNDTVQKLLGQINMLSMQMMAKK